ncbi:MAG: hypothetical protein J6Y98_04025 [Bacteroidales bacterium]|nr:hypothetical protein [Bacteroidales bacterium]
MNLADFSAMGWIILGLTITSFVTLCLFFFMGLKWHEANLYRRHDKEGMRRMIVYDSPLYMYVGTFFISVLIAIFAAFLMVGVFEGVLWIICWILKILAIIIIVVAWIAIVGGIICTIAMQLWGILVAIAGGLLLAAGRWLKEVMTDGVEWCEDLLSDVWEMSTDVVAYGIDNIGAILLIIATPVLIILAIAAVIIIVDLICMGTESIINSIYKVHRKCPYCGNDKGFDYIINGKVHPVPLHPGMYGIFYQHTPDGEKIPTMLLNGRGKLTRRCPNCHKDITNEGDHTYGTDIHIGIVGAPAAGKSYMLYTSLDTMEKKYNPHLTQTDKDDETDIEQKNKLIKKGGDIQTATSQRYHAVQMMFKPDGRPVPYHLYFYDVAGEAFNQKMDEDTRKMALQFYDNVKSIVFVLDPHRFDPKAPGVRYSFEFLEWIKSHGGDESDVYNPNELYNRLREFIIQSGRKLKEIDFNFALAKSDMGYLKALKTQAAEGENILEKVIKNDLGLSATLISASKDFRSVNFYSVSALNGSNSVPKMFVEILNRQGVKEMQPTDF